MRPIAPVPPNILQAGAVISATLITENIYGSPTGRILLVPQGTLVVGQYDNNVQVGQSRVPLV